MKNDHDLLVRLDENVRSLVGTVKDKFDGQAAALRDHEKRLRLLETSEGQAQGVQIGWTKLLTAMGAIGGLIGAFYWVNH